MSEIQRWEVDNIISSKTHYKFEKGRYVLYEDHVAAMQAARPQPKFKVGDRVLCGKDLGTVTEPERESDRVAVSWDDGDYSTVRFSDVTLYVPPVTTCGCPGGYAKVAEVPTPAAEVKAAAIKAAVEAERVRCLEIVEKIHGCVVGIDGYLRLDPYGELVSRSRVETAIRWVKVK